MADKSKQSDLRNEYNVGATGLNLDSSQNNLKKGALSYALNASVENYDSNSVNYQNEPGNEECFDFPQDYVLVGKHFIPEQDKIIFFLTNPGTDGNEIGYMVNNDCTYRTLVNDPCLNFDVNSPILKVVHKITNFGTELYWPDNNGRRYLDIDNIPYLPVDDPVITADGSCEVTYTDQLDCNQLLLVPDINIPYLEIDDVLSGGEITSGTYQFAVQYADSVGNPYTSYYGVTNPTPIADTNIVSVNFDVPVGKSIVVNVQNLNPLGQYQYFNLAVIQTVNGVSTPFLVGTYFIDDIFKKITYTGQIQTDIQLSINDIFERFTYYDKADYVTAVQDILVWKGVTAVPRLNYQTIANKITLEWASYRIPAAESYADELNATNLRGYLRDEVYAFEIVFLLKNGKETDAFHIPGRASEPSDIVADFGAGKSSGDDYIGDESTRDIQPRWQVYNTASVIADYAEYEPGNASYKGPYQYGKFSYWESTEEYPCDEEVWGELAGQKIRHHKMPDVLVSPIIESSTDTNLVSEDVAIYALGVKISTSQIQALIKSSGLTSEQQSEIVGYKITRADRGVNKSIVAKGMLRNVGSYEREGQNFYYPNYPYNDVANTDPFLNSINNAWTQLCEPFTIEVFELPDSDEEGAFLEVEYTSCNTNKAASIKYRSLGTFTLCSITKPVPNTTQPVNDVQHRPWDNPPIPTSNTACNVSYQNYDVYEIGRLRNRGLRIEWEDITMGTHDEWFNGVGDGSQPNWRVHVRVGTIPVKTGGNGEELIRLQDEVRVDTCEEETPVDPLTTTQTDPLRQVFNSPETSFGQPFLGDILKLESVMYGAGKAHFVEVKDNAKYRLLTKEAQQDALLAAERVGNITGDFNLDAMFSIYQSYLTIYINGITKKNYAYSFNSIASYNYAAPVPNDMGIKQRQLDIKRYLIPQVISVGEEDGSIINNYQRESSVFLRTSIALPYPHLSSEMTSTGVVEDSRFTITDAGNCSNPEKEEDISVVSYYGSIKNQFLNQYGQVYSYDSIDTGFTKLLLNRNLSEDIIFGGDTFIGRFAYKTKVPFFIDNRVNAPDDSDIFYDEIGNIAYPKYWHSSRSILETHYGEDSGLVLTNFISYKATNFDCPNSQELVPPDADPVEFADQNPDRTYYDGYYYLFAYGVPSFYCESSYNLDLRTAFNTQEGDFWPNVSTGIPDEWVQETNVSIANDNTYNYNTTFSKQNKESVITNRPADWGDEDDRNVYPFRAIYSDRQVIDTDNRTNNWLTYRPVSFFDFPQNFGALTALDSLQDSAVLARFENKSLLYNNLLTIDTSNPQAAYVGNATLFEGAPPIDYADTDQGYVGSQNKFMLKTPYGAVSVDAKRGQVFLLNGTNVKDLTQFGSGMNRWFVAHLPFEILKHFPDIPTDNHFNGIGLHGVYDSNYERIIITKLDYIPKSDDIFYQDGKWYKFLPAVGDEAKAADIPKEEVFLSDSDNFCNVSWTLSFSFVTNSWISFHSYLPNFYVGENNFFYSGLNQCPNDFDFVIGTIDDSLTTTTTTTVVVLPSTTTTTTTTEAPKDCSFDVDITLPDCELEGEAVYVDSPGRGPCTRPNDLTVDSFYHTYTITLGLSEDTIDSTVSSDLACTHLNYFLVQDPSWNYEGQFYEVEREDIAVSGKVFERNFTDDCTTIPDGWYFTPTTAEEGPNVFRVEGGEITEIVNCNSFTASTTTTTTTLATTEYCYQGIYTDPDPDHPFGGVIVYIDANGDTQTLTEIWDTDTEQFDANVIISTSGVTQVACTTTTTTTV